VARLRLALLALVLILAALAAALYVALRPDRSSATAAIPVDSAAAATWPAGARRAPVFALRDEDGKPVALRALRGATTIVTFVDPLCRDFCPTEVRRLGDAVRRADPSAAIVAVSTNVYGNDRAALKQDERKWNVVPRWHWAVGSRLELERVWHQYGVQVIETKKTVAGVTTHEISHTLAAYVVGPDGSERALLLWPFTARAAADALRAVTAS